MRRGFTLIELLVVIAVIALLIGILLPSLGSARTQARIAAEGSSLHQIGIGLEIYMSDYDRTLPQVLAPGYDGQLDVVAQLFGGKKGTLNLFGIAEVGASSRPLNEYVTSVLYQPDEETPNGSLSAVEVEIFESPLDRGMENTGLPPSLGASSVDSVYDFLGSSYNLNDHALDMNPFDEEIPTLIPEGGGIMPRIADTTKTWVIGSFPIYNYDDASDRTCRWLSRRRGRDDTTDESAGLLFLDSHVESAVPVPTGQLNTTNRYTFLPTPDWEERVKRK